MARKLDGSRFTMEFVNAVEGSTVNRSVYPMADGLSNGEVGCYLSHVEVWKRLSESDHESALILEDDVLFKSDTDALCNAFSLLPFEVDLIRMSSLKQAKGERGMGTGSTPPAHRRHASERFTGLLAIAHRGSKTAIESERAIARAR